jgi:ribosome biogenesis protein MAK21
MDETLAMKLINIYFTLFELFVKEGEVESKMLEGLLTGINRAFPYAPFSEKE